MLKTLFIAISLSVALSAQQVDGEGNYLTNDAPIKGKVQMSLLNPGGLWKVRCAVLDAYSEPNANSKVVRSFSQDDILQANAGTGGSDEGLRNVKDSQGQYWMSCRDLAGNDLNCWVNANTLTLTPLNRPSEVPGSDSKPTPASKPSAGASQPLKAMIDIPDAARTDEGGGPSLRPYVVQLEAMMRWEANEGAWKARRSAWSLEVIQAKQVSKLAALVAELESNTKWAAVDDKWSKARDAWSKQVAAATSRKALSQLLQQFESNLKWESMSDDWKGAREGWYENVGNAAKQ
ncbi:hypothetical protein JST97_02960 [bacterium]|nr:hypothetical protein [bacterium]